MNPGRSVFNASCLQVSARNPSAVWTLLLLFLISHMRNLKGQQNFWCPICRRKAAANDETASMNQRETTLRCPTSKAWNFRHRSSKKRVVSFRKDCQGKTGLSSNRTSWVSSNMCRGQCYQDFSASSGALEMKLRTATQGTGWRWTWKDLVA